MQKIMIIEDEPAVRQELALLLQNEGWQAIPVEHFHDIPGQAASLRPDLILLDLNLPEKDGFTLCAQLRSRKNTPIIFVTGRESAMDELHALSLGGDDYITKPYNIPLLLARIRAVLRRSTTQAAPDVMLVNGLALDLAKGIITNTDLLSADAAQTELTRNELRILAHLMNHPGQIVSRADLIETLWNSHIYIDDNTLSVNMTRLRAKLADLGLPDYIRTRRGLGYQI